jgi:hypothetical protein
LYIFVLELLIKPQPFYALGNLAYFNLSKCKQTTANVNKEETSQGVDIIILYFSSFTLPTLPKQQGCHMAQPSIA